MGSNSQIGRASVEIKHECLSANSDWGEVCLVVLLWGSLDTSSLSGSGSSGSDFGRSDSTHLCILLVGLVERDWSILQYFSVGLLLDTELFASDDLSRGSQRKSGRSHQCGRKQDVVHGG